MLGLQDNYAELDVSAFMVASPEELPAALSGKGLGLLSLDAPATPGCMLELAHLIGEARQEYSSRPSDNVYGGAVLRITADQSDGLLSPAAIPLHVDEPASPPYNTEPPDGNEQEWYKFGQPRAILLGCTVPPEPHKGGQTKFFDSVHLYQNLDAGIVTKLGQWHQRFKFPDIGEHTAFKPVLPGSLECPEINYSDIPEHGDEHGDNAWWLVDPESRPIDGTEELRAIKAMREVFSEHTMLVPWEAGLVVAWVNNRWLHGRIEQAAPKRQASSKRELHRVKLSRLHIEQLAAAPPQ